MVYRDAVRHVKETCSPAGQNVAGFRAQGDDGVRQNGTFVNVLIVIRFVERAVQNSLTIRFYRFRQVNNTLCARASERVLEKRRSTLRKSSHVRKRSFYCNIHKTMNTANNIRV